MLGSGYPKRLLRKSAAEQEKPNHAPAASIECNSGYIPGFPNTCKESEAKGKNYLFMTIGHL